MEKLEEAADLLAELEDEKDVTLGNTRDALMRAGLAADSRGAYLRHMQNVAGRLAGLGIEAGREEIASEAAALIADLDDVESDRD